MAMSSDASNSLSSTEQATSISCIGRRMSCSVRAWAEYPGHASMLLVTGWQIRHPLGSVKMAGCIIWFAKQTLRNKSITTCHVSGNGAKSDGRTTTITLLAQPTDTVTGTCTHPPFSVGGNFKLPVVLPAMLPHSPGPKPGSIAHS